MEHIELLMTFLMPTLLVGAVALRDRSYEPQLIIGIIILFVALTILLVFS